MFEKLNDDYEYPRIGTPEDAGGLNGSRHKDKRNND